MTRRIIIPGSALPYKVARFRPEKELRQGFAALVKDEPLMAGELALFDHLAGYASRETDERSLVLTLVVALRCAATGLNHVNLSRLAEILVDDAEVAQKAKNILAGVALRQSEISLFGQ